MESVSFPTSIPTWTGKEQRFPLPSLHYALSWLERMLIISSPEYAHGVPGSLKNALDWLVSGAEMPGKPTALLNASARSVHAHAHLEETLRTMSARIVDDAVVVVPLDGRRVDAGQIVADPALSALVRGATLALAHCAHSLRPHIERA
jgi:Predicted flavoprotein